MADFQVGDLVSHPDFSDSPAVREPTDTSILDLSKPRVLATIIEIIDRPLWPSARLSDYPHLEWYVGHLQLAEDGFVTWTKRVRREEECTESKTQNQT